VKKLSCKLLKEYIKDEKQGARSHSKHGLPNLAKDERRHRLFLTRIYKKNCGAMK
jgi:hypothetical protein